MSNLSVFSFKDKNEVRIQILKDEPWFCLRDVCSILSLSVASPARFQMDNKGVTQNVTLTERGEQKLTFINEPNLYRVIFRSNKPEARQFQDWVFNEVLPAIRKTGSYSAVAAAPAPQTNALVTAREPLNGEQRKALADVVAAIANQFQFKRAWVSAIWFALRRATLSKAPEPFLVEELPALVFELRRIVMITELTKAVSASIERDVIKKTIRRRQPASTVFRNAGEYGRENLFSPDIPAKFEVMLRGIEGKEPPKKNLLGYRK